MRKLEANRFSYLLLTVVCLSSFRLPVQAKTDWDKSLAKGYHELAVGNTENAISIFTSKVKGHPD